MSQQNITNPRTTYPTTPYLTTTAYPYVECSVGVIIIKVDSVLECFSYQLPVILNNIGMGYICIVFCVLLIIISIFGKIKDSYKWFILNQAIWDLLVSYDFICANPSFSETKQFCVYSSFKRYLNTIISAEACYQLFLLSFSRFLALFFHKFYGRHSTPIKIISAITIYNFSFMFVVNLREIYYFFIAKTDTLFYICLVLEYLFSLLTIIFSLVFIVLILIKIFQRFRFQMQNDRANTIGTLRIASVLLFNCITISIFFAFTSVYQIYYTIVPQFSSIVNNRPIEIQAHEWIDRIKKNQKCINVIRILLDSIVILFVLSGYRKNILAVFKICSKSKTTTSTVKIISSQRL